MPVFEAVVTALSIRLGFVIGLLVGAVTGHYLSIVWTGVIIAVIIAYVGTITFLEHRKWKRDYALRTSQSNS